ncbi:MAG: hypothetical protein FJX74_14580 [Armatimonadetes bacterium]|nr:hypothetical protein [Armatimonadota bacterium]
MKRFPVHGIGLQRALALILASFTMAVMVAPGAVSAAGNKALEVLRKAVLAQGHVAYSSVGTVTGPPGQGARPSTQTVFRQVGGRERIKVQDGAGRAVWLRVCDGKTSWEHHPGTGQVFTRVQPPAERLRARELFNLEMLGANYDVRLVGAETIAGRQAYRIRIGSTGSERRPVREVWIDQAKYVELRTQGFGPDGRAIRSVVVDRINFAPTFPAGAFAFASPPRCKTRAIAPSRFVGSVSAAAKQAGFGAHLPPRVPAGFALYPNLASVREIRGVTVLWFQYTDGVRQFSVFERSIPPGGKEPPPGRGWARTVRVGDAHFTIVGQLSPQEFETITAGYAALPR